jgi:diguanylate cyclase (GGDEF)-like protein
VLFLDLDHFKALNDTYGHLAGDAALRTFGDVALSALRAVDVLGRWGGEDFVALLPEIELADALAVAERVREAVAAQPLEACNGAHLTCSIGVAVYPADATDVDGLVTAADRAMYAAKRLGRNQVRSAGDPAVAALDEVAHAIGSREDATLFGTVEALAAVVEARDRHSGEHADQVAALSRQLAIALGLDAMEVNAVAVAGRLHDVGKVSVPDSLLGKADRLSAKEWELLRAHPALGADLVSRVPGLRRVAPIIRGHHERWDGRGYPDGVAGEAIPHGARIVAVIDAYCAMTTNRAYREARSAEEALTELWGCAGTQFDPGVVRMLAHLLRTEVLEASLATAG